MKILALSALASVASSESCIETYNFSWRGQFAGFIVNGQFSYNKADIPSNGIIREEHLQGLDVSFYDPQGNHLRTYEDNHLQPVNSEGKPYLNFAFDTISQELLQDGTFNVDDDENRYRNGFTMGEGDPTFRKQNGVQTGLAFWSRPADNKTPHLHVDDWNIADPSYVGEGEFGFPIGYSSHEDASFPYATTTEKIDGGKVGSAYYASVNGIETVNALGSDVDAYGQLVRVVRVNTCAATDSDSTCVDQDGDCEYWASTGECEGNPFFMGKLCAKSCNTCGDEEKCAAACSSSSDIEFLSSCDENLTGSCACPLYEGAETYCGYSCAGGKWEIKCQDDEEAVAPACENSNSECEYWAANGECTKNRGYMLSKCAKSCDSCS